MAEREGWLVARRARTAEHVGDARRERSASTAGRFRLALIAPARRSAVR